MAWSFIDDGDRYFENYNLYQLSRDEFYLTFRSNMSKSLSFLYTLHKECLKCPFAISKNLPPSEKHIITAFKTNLRFRIASSDDITLPQDQTESVICDIDKDFGQFGVYDVIFSDDGCIVNTLKEPVNIYTPILTVVLFYVLICGLIAGIIFCWKKFKKAKHEEKELTAKKIRIKSLDTFRGITIVLMIFVNFGCGGYDFLEHATWNGLHVADLVFPCFIWIMGACIPMSLMSSFKKNLSNKEIFYNILKRSIKLFCLGIFLGSGSNLKYLRIFGVLQRFGVAYFVAATICMFCLRKLSNPKETKTWKYIADVMAVSGGWIVALLFLLIHTIIIFCVAQPGCPSGYMGPGGLHENQSYSDCIGGATGYIDGLLLGNHRYQKPTILKVYLSKPFDPEGVVGCLTTIFHVFFGVQAGVTLTLFKKPKERLLRWLIWAVVCGLIGGALCGFSKEDGVIPVNKNLWSLSFVLVTSCFAFTLLSFCYVLVDVKKWWSGKPFLFAGMNAILMYIGHEMTDGHFPVRWEVENIEGLTQRTHFISLMSDSWGTAVWVLISYYLYKINYFFTI